MFPSQRNQLVGIFIISTLFLIWLVRLRHFPHDLSLKTNVSGLDRYIVTGRSS